jgi:hypothetical protein
VVTFTPRPLYPQVKSPLYPMNRRLGGPQSRSGRGDKEKNSQPRRESNSRTPIGHYLIQGKTTLSEKLRKPQKKWLPCRKSSLITTFEPFTAVMFQVEVFWVVTPCSVTVGCQRFRDPCCLYLQGEMYVTQRIYWTFKICV